MPILIPRAVTPRLSKQLASSSRICSYAQVRCRHETAAADSSHGQTDLEQHVNEYAPPLRARRHGFRSLPMSPLMTGENAKRTRRPKAPRDDALKDFQKEVAMNPYAQALATPIRHCALTLARLPSHFLLPFATTLEKLPATTNAQSPKLKARIKPGRPADFTENTLAQTSYVLNRQDMVRHLSRKKHWINLISERQKEKFASIAHRSPSANGLVKDHWVWQDQVDAATAMLEKEVVDAIRCAVKARGQDKCSSASATGEDAFALAFDRDDAREGGIGAHVETDLQAYILASLLSPESLDILRRELTQTSTDMVYISKSSEAYKVQLSIDRLKAFNDFNEIQKELPQVQNPPGTRAARLKREEEEREALLSGQDEVQDRV